MKDGPQNVENENVQKHFLFAIIEPTCKKIWSNGWPIQKLIRKNSEKGPEISKMKILENETKHFFPIALKVFPKKKLVKKKNIIQLERQALRQAAM